MNYLYLIKLLVSYQIKFFVFITEITLKAVNKYSHIHIKTESMCQFLQTFFKIFGMIFFLISKTLYNQKNYYPLILFYILLKFLTRQMYIWMH